MRKNIHGILLLDKPMYMTSNGALQKMKWLFNANKAGHTGSLDPIATGMLPICFGEATKFSQFLLESDKTYYVTAQLGIETTTADREGEIIAKKAVENIDREKVIKVFENFLGDIKQIPPMYSAIKFQGEPLYKLARKGIQIERAPRSVKIFSLVFDALENEQLKFTVHCSKGTYIRTLVEDMGRELGCGAHVTELRRLTVVPYEQNVMYTLSALESIAQTAGQDALVNCLLPIETAVQIYPIVKLNTSSAFYLRMGQAVRAANNVESAFVRLIDDNKRFLGLGEVTADGRIKPHRLLSASSG